ncbi:MAG TPA: agmatine deiminase family protein [Gammaproteobacteria bacterium]|nr:agmatine deiminase family protein [Gammaproteobacteria bacterium]
MAHLDSAPGAAAHAPPLLIPEFAPQSGVILTWPHPGTDWKPRLAEIEALYTRIAGTIVRYEPLLILCYDIRHRDHVGRLLARGNINMQAVRLAAVKTNDTWVRDYGPITVARANDLELYDFTFDGWGGKYPAALDNRAGRKLFDSGCFATREFRHQQLVLEGGSIDSDGCGTLLTTRRCLLESGRNPGYGRDRLESWFREHLGIERVLWLAHGKLAGDDTDAHVDMLARFCTPDTIVYSSCADPEDEHYTPLAAMAQQLQTFRTREGSSYELIPLPLPRPVRDAHGRRLPASYANFLVINGAVLLPVYDDPADALALDTLAGCFPERRVEPLNCLPLIHQNGSLHCATMQLPAGVLKRDEETG